MSPVRGSLGVGLHGPHLHDLFAPEARQHRPPAPARRHAEQHRASLRRVRSGPFEPFTLVHVGSYAADIQHSGEAIADHLKSSFAIICFNSRTYESGGIMAVVKAHAAAEHFEGVRVWPERTRSTQHLALFPGRNGSGSGGEPG